MIEGKTYLPFLYKFFLDDLNADFTFCFRRHKLEKRFDYPQY